MLRLAIRHYGYAAAAAAAAAACHSFRLPLFFAIIADATPAFAIDFDAAAAVIACHYADIAAYAAVSILLLAAITPDIA